MDIYSIEEIFVNVLLPLFPLALMLLVLKTLLIPARHAKSFSRAPEINPNALDGFISFKTVPDEPTAASIVESLREFGCRVRFIHGDTECPHPFASAKATSWIRKTLSEGVGESTVLMVLFSTATLDSEWVCYEALIGSEECTAIAFLSLDGIEDLTRFPRFRFLPSCTIYAMDFSASDKGIEDLRNLLTSVRTSRSRGIRNRAIVTIAMVAVWLFPLIVFWVSESEDLRQTILVVWWWLIVGSLGTGVLFYPSAYPVRTDELSACTIRLRRGFDIFRFVTSVSLLGYVAFGLAFAFTDLPPIPLSGVFMPVGLAFAAYVFVRVRKGMLLRQAAKGTRS